VDSSATGGIDPWPADRYLNLWVCPGATGPFTTVAETYAYSAVDSPHRPDTG
jgi:hypothetical protein